MDDPVVAQLAAYNAHDVDAFVACYAVDATIANGDGRILLSGHAQLRESYGHLFEQHPDVHAEVSERLREGAWVVDHELVRTGAAASGYVVAYRVRDGVIDRVVILGE